MIADLLSRPTYLYSEVDRLIGVPAGTARRWINGYTRAGKQYLPILRREPGDPDWATWGEFVEARMLSEYRDQNIATRRLRAAVQALRVTFGLQYPLAYLDPYLEAAAGELVISTEALGDSEPLGMVAATSQLLLDSRGLRVVRTAPLTRDSAGRQFVREIPVRGFPGIVMRPDLRSGQPVFAGTGTSVSTVVGMLRAGDPIERLAGDYELSIEAIEDAARYTDELNRAA